jgi:hypothetical protein
MDTEQTNVNASAALLDAKPGHVRKLPVSRIRPSPENDRVYKPIDAGDPHFVAFVEDVRRHGVKEPLVLSQDWYILSGHRRFAAAKRLGLQTVPCRVEPVIRGSPGFVQLLVAFNNQRLKSFDELLREQVVASSTPEGAYQELIKHRRAQAHLDLSLEVIQPEGGRRRSKISAAKMPLLNAAKKVLDELKPLWPVTDRRVHYILLNDPPLYNASQGKKRAVYSNTLKRYKGLCDLLTRARVEGLIPYDAIHDPTRPMRTWHVHRDASRFVREEVDGLFKGYWRDLQQSQPNHIEIVGEKNTVEDVIHPIAEEFCIPYTLGRGYCSLDRRKKMVERFRRSGKEKLVVLLGSDFDPDGTDISGSFVRSLVRDFNIPPERVVGVQFALTAQQVLEMGLPSKMTPGKAKKKSSRRKKFVERHGDDVFELEAVPVEQMQAILRRSIEKVLDVAAYHAEQDKERRDCGEIDRLRRQVKAALGPTLSSRFSQNGHEPGNGE